MGPGNSNADENDLQCQMFNVTNNDWKFYTFSYLESENQSLEMYVEKDLETVKAGLATTEEKAVAVKMEKKYKHAIIQRVPNSHVEIIRQEECQGVLGRSFVLRMIMMMTRH